MKFPYTGKDERKDLTRGAWRCAKRVRRRRTRREGHLEVRRQLFEMRLPEPPDPWEEFREKLDQAYEEWRVSLYPQNDIVMDDCLDDFAGFRASVINSDLLADIDDESSYDDDDYQPTEQDEWLDYDPDC